MTRRLFEQFRATLLGHYRHDRSAPRSASAPGYPLRQQAGHPHAQSHSETLSGQAPRRQTITQALAMPGIENIEFDPPVWNSCSSHPPANEVRTRHQCRFRTSQGRRQANAKVSAWIANVDTSALFLSAITVMELEIGIQRAERKDPRQGIVLRAWMNGRVMPTFAAQVLPIDVKIARRCAAGPALRNMPDRRSERDALIAATALVHGMIVVTRNVADFTPLGTPLLNPWSSD